MLDSVATRDRSSEPQVIVPALRPGTSALEWLDRNTWAKALWLASLLMLPGAHYFFAGPLEGIAYVAASVSLMVMIGLHEWTSARLREAHANERYWGYTTLYGSIANDLLQLEPRTGRVIRAPGGPTVRRPLGPRLRLGLWG